MGKDGPALEGRGLDQGVGQWQGRSQDSGAEGGTWHGSRPRRAPGGGGPLQAEDFGQDPESSGLAVLGGASWSLGPGVEAVAGVQAGWRLAGCPAKGEALDCWGAGRGTQERPDMGFHKPRAGGEGTVTPVQGHGSRYPRDVPPEPAGGVADLLEGTQACLGLRLWAHSEERAPVSSEVGHTPGTNAEDPHSLSQGQRLATREEPCRPLARVTCALSELWATMPQAPASPWVLLLHLGVAVKDPHPPTSPSTLLKAARKAGGCAPSEVGGWGCGAGAGPPARLPCHLWREGQRLKTVPPHQP